MDSRIRFLVGRCVSFGEGMTYYPLREVLQQLGAFDAPTIRALLPDDDEADSIAGRLASLLVATDTIYPRVELRWAAQRLLSALAEERPLCLLIEDIHWAEDTFLELIEHTVEATSNPLLILCAARPELLEGRPEWGAAGARRSTVELQPLSEDESRRLLAALGSGRNLNPEERARVIAIGEGNPLFLEQFVALASD